MTSPAYDKVIAVLHEVLDGDSTDETLCDVFAAIRDMDLLDDIGGDAGLETLAGHISLNCVDKLIGFMRARQQRVLASFA